MVNLLWHLPFSVIDRRLLRSIGEARVGQMATLRVTVGEHRPALARGRPYRVRVYDAKSALDLVYFKMAAPFLRQLLPPGQERFISGRVDSYDGLLQMAHPDLVLPVDKADQIGSVRPVYRGTAGLQPATLENLILRAVALAPDLPEWIDRHLLAREGWPSWREALRIAHNPETQADIDGSSVARRRLAYDEILASQLALALLKQDQRSLRGRETVGDKTLTGRVMAACGFSLTGSQTAALAEIAGDMASPRRMLRLLQGDVGSGKTIVALLAMLIAVEAGGQAALMAPTEILARQHWTTIEPLCIAAGVKAALLLGQGRGLDRAPVLSGLANGSIGIVIGTHALVQQHVAFHDLRMAVVDEQHRFGVDNRLDLAAKGMAVDLLLMSATPIPRTLALTAHGDLDISLLKEKPPGRKPIDTRAIPLDRLDEVMAALARHIATGAQAYWVCPLVEETELSDFAAAKQRSLTLAAMFGEGKVGLVHGRLKSSEKAAAMQDFVSGKLSILVATTVIEVGINVPAATLMIIEHAERYGLAQIHQLRGRVGRGGEKSTCLLLYTGNASMVARERLKIVRASEDGFYLAEEDLRLRGSGDIMGTRQSGLPDFRLADTAAQLDLIATADDQAKLVLSRNPDLTGPEGEALRILLYLFERDQAMKYLRSG